MYWPFRKSQIFVTDWTSKSWSGNFARGICRRLRVSVVYLLCESCVRILSNTLSLRSCSFNILSDFINFNMSTAILSAHSEENFSSENRWYGNLLNIDSVKPKIQINVNFSWTCKNTYKLIKTKQKKKHLKNWNVWKGNYYQFYLNKLNLIV